MPADRPVRIASGTASEDDEEMKEEDDNVRDL